MIFSNRKQRYVPQLNTSSLPDLIFTVLFFFMVVTHMRQVTVKVRFRVPQGTELTRLTKKSAVSYIYIGRPSDGTAANVPLYDGVTVQLNDKYATPDEVSTYVKAERDRMSGEDQEQQIVSVKADRTTPMSLINEVKLALRRADVRRMSYSAEQKK